MHTLSVGLVTTAAQSQGEFQMPFSNPLDSTRIPTGALFCLPTSGTAWVHCVCQPVRNCLPSYWCSSIPCLLSNLLSCNRTLFLLLSCRDSGNSSRTNEKEMARAFFFRTPPMGLHACVCVCVYVGYTHTDCTISAGDFPFYILLRLTLAF